MGVCNKELTASAGGADFIKHKADSPKCKSNQSHKTGRGQATSRPKQCEMENLERAPLKQSVQDPIPLWASTRGPAPVGRISSPATSLDKVLAGRESGIPCQGWTSFDCNRISCHSVWLRRPPHRPQGGHHVDLYKGAWLATGTGMPLCWPQQRALLATVY